jgi:hypothetical protein
VQACNNADVVGEILGNVLVGIGQPLQCTHDMCIEISILDQLSLFDQLLGFKDENGFGKQWAAEERQSMHITWNPHFVVEAAELLQLFDQPSN